VDVPTPLSSRPMQLNVECKMLYNPLNPTFAADPFAFVSYLIIFIFSISD